MNKAPALPGIERVRLSQLILVTCHNRYCGYGSSGKPYTKSMEIVKCRLVAPITTIDVQN